MIDWERVIKGLGEILAYCHEQFGKNDHDAQAQLTRMNQTAKDAIELLKALEPRVVKMSELTAGEPMLVWLEDIDKEETVAGMIFDYVPGRLGFKLTYHGCMDRIYPLIDEYLTRWRCWTSRPTDEQREAIPWN